MMMMIQFAIVVKNDRTPKQNIVVLFYSVVLRPVSKNFTCRICVIEIVTFEIILGFQLYLKSLPL